MLPWGRHELAVHLGGEVAVSALHGLARLGQACQVAGRLEEPKPNCSRPGPGRPPPLSTWPPPGPGSKKRSTTAKRSATSSVPKGSAWDALVALARRGLIPRCSAHSTPFRASVVLPTSASPVITAPRRAVTARVNWESSLCRPTIGHPGMPEGIRGKIGASSAWLLLQAGPAVVCPHADVIGLLLPL